MTDVWQKDTDSVLPEYVEARTKKCRGKSEQQINRLMAFWLLPERPRPRPSSLTVTQGPIWCLSCEPMLDTASAPALNVFHTFSLVVTTGNLFWVVPSPLSGSQELSTQHWTRVWTQLKVVKSMKNWRREFLMPRTKTRKEMSNMEIVF